VADRPNYTTNREQIEQSAADLFDAIGQGILDVGPSHTSSTISFSPIVISRGAKLSVQ
jgi:hypothetical protein